MLYDNMLYDNTAQDLNVHLPPGGFSILGSKAECWH